MSALRQRLALLTAMAAITACASGSVGGATEMDPGENDDGIGAAGASNRAPDPFAVGELPTSSALRQNILERRAIFEGNWLASDVFAKSINAELNASGIQGFMTMSKMSPTEAPEARLEMTVDIPTNDDPTSTDPPDYAACPFAAPSNPAATSLSCRFVVSQAVRRAFTEKVQALHENPVTEDYVKDAPNPEGVRNWYETAVDFGLEHSVIYALQAMRDVRACDQEATPEENAYERGVEIGREALREAVATQAEQTPRTRCDTDAAIVNPAINNVMGRIGDLADNNPLCDGYAPSNRDETARLTNATDEMREGIVRGVEEQGLVESGRLVREWVCIPPPPPVDRFGGGGDGGGDGGGGGGDPLVLDLDGNGISVEPLHLGPVMDFGWGGKARTEWTAPGDAFVVLDRNGDGDIDQTELFGDVSVTEDGMLARDGFEALALYDAEEHGGNDDGVVDHRDEVFVALGAWTDRDGDGSVDSGELVSLEEAGVAAIDIDRQTFTRTNGEEGEARDLFFNYVFVE